MSYNDLSNDPFGSLPSEQDEKRIQEARRIMGDAVKDLPDDELQIYLTKFQFLIDSWLDDYERKAYEGKTLREVIEDKYPNRFSSYARKRFTEDDLSPRKS